MTKEQQTQAEAAAFREQGSEQAVPGKGGGNYYLYNLETTITQGQTLHSGGS